MTDPGIPQIEGATPARSSGLRRLLVVLLVSTTIIFAVGFGLYIYFGADKAREVFDSVLGGNGQDVLETPSFEDNQRFFYSPDSGFAVRLVADQGETSNVTLSISVEAASLEAADAMKSMSPVIENEVYQFLRGLRPSDFSGGLGLFRIREELTIRISRAVAPYKVISVLIRSINFS